MDDSSPRERLLRKMGLPLVPEDTEDPTCPLDNCFILLGLDETENDATILSMLADAKLKRQGDLKRFGHIEPSTQGQLNKAVERAALAISDAAKIREHRKTIREKRLEAIMTRAATPLRESNTPEGAAQAFLTKAAPRFGFPPSQVGSAVAEVMSEIARRRGAWPRGGVGGGVDPAEQARQLLLTQLQDAISRGDDRTAATIAANPALAGYPPAVAFQPQVDQAVARVNAVHALQAAIAGGMEQATADAWDDGVLGPTTQPCPLAQPYAPQVEEARRRLQVLAQAETLGDDAETDLPEVIKLWIQNRQLLLGSKDPRVQAFIAHVQLIEKQLHAFDGLKSAFAAGRRSERQIARAWQELAKHGTFSLAESYRGEAERAVRQAQAIDKFCTIPDQNDESTDRALCSAWDGPLLRDCNDAKPQEERYRLAKVRLGLLDDLRQALQRGDTHKVAEAAARPELQGFQYAAREQAASIADAEKGRKRLADALRARPDLDIPIAEAYEKLTRAGQAPALRHADAERVKLACKRKEVLARLREIPNQMDEAPDRAVAAIWDAQTAELLAGCSDLSPDERRRYPTCVLRIKAYDLLAEAMGRGDDPAIASLADPRILSGYPPVQRAAQEIAAARDRARRANDLLDALKKGDAGRIRELFDPSLLERYSGSFGERELEQLRDAFKSELAKVRMRPHEFRDHPVELVGDDFMTAWWEWPSDRKIKVCLVRIAAEQPPQSPNAPRDLDEAILDVPRDQYEQGLHRFGIKDSWRGKRVFLSIWPVLKLGRLLCYGPKKLELGPFPIPKIAEQKRPWRKITERIQKGLRFLGGQSGRSSTPDPQSERSDAD